MQATDSDGCIVTSESTVYGGGLIICESAALLASSTTTARAAALAANSFQPRKTFRGGGAGNDVSIRVLIFCRHEADGAGLFQAFSSSSSSVSFMILAPHSARMPKASPGDSPVPAADAT